MITHKTLIYTLQPGDEPLKSFIGEKSHGLTINSTSVDEHDDDDDDVAER